MAWSPGKISATLRALRVLEKCLRLHEAPQLGKRSYHYKLDRVLRAPMNLIMNIGQNDLVGQRFELAL